MKKLLITGANGYLGSNFLKLVQDSAFEIYATDRIVQQNAGTKISWIQADLEDTAQTEKIFKTLEPDYMLHMAWGLEGNLKHDEAVQKHWVNISMDLVQLFAKYGGKRIIATGTCAEYQWTEELLKEDSTPIDPKSIYGICKNKFHLELADYCNQCNLSYLWSRIFYSFGPYELPQRIVPYVIHSIARGEEVLTSHGNQVYDYLYVEDVVRALMELIDNEFSGTVNICSGKPQKLKDLILEIANQMDGKELLRFGAIEDDKHTHDYVVGSNEHLKKITGWKQRISIEEGIKKTIQYLLA
jgi:nucleoside-diphosphate-sugar epimerase